MTATIDDIAAEAGLGKGTIYEYFDSKAQIFTALRGRYIERTVAAGDRAMPAQGPVIEQIRAFVAGMFGFAVADAQLVSLLFHEAGIDEADELGPVAARLVGLVRAGVAAGELGVADPEFSVEFLLHGLHGVLEHALARGVPTEQVLAKLAAPITALLDPR
ncbi:TetR/AcrR family transcriptional regulator [Asanoa sp. NPDC049573]|uniref:TetR/AcrR family transcriptional regulator n=1 Tax=Asanoa sp. NPDC049573 TaxID=3155396 RepID=UPI00343891CE